MNGKDKKLIKKPVLAQRHGREIQTEEEDKVGRLISHIFNVINVKNGDTLQVNAGPRKINTRKKKKPDLCRKMMKKTCY